MKDRLVIREEKSCYRISWWLADESEYGADLGETLNAGQGEPPPSRDAFECWVANRTVLDLKAARDESGFYWNTKPEALAVLRQIRVALDQDRPLPEWAKTALAQGWKPPKGWKA